MSKPDFNDGLRQENIDDRVLNYRERLLFEATSLHQYKIGRKKRGLPPLTKWQEEALSAERLTEMIFKGSSQKKAIGIQKLKRS